MASLTLSGICLAREGIPRKQIGLDSPGKVFEWSSKDGLAYTYIVPKNYQPKTGANLTFILHGSNLTRLWGFANHRAGEFRPDDLVVCPDGTTASGQGGFDFLGQPADLERLHALHQKLKQVFKIRATYIYGHSQGSFFAFHYAGAYPDEVQGVVGHASGVWTWTRLEKGGHSQAILLMHGTQDPLVPYFQSAGGFEAFRKAEYPLVRLRSLEGWNHWPAELNSPTRHVSQQLAWCEGMTTGDPDRLAASFNFLCEVKEKEWHDYAALYGVALRVKATKRISQALFKRSEGVLQAIDKLASAHREAVEKSLGGNKAAKFDGQAWAGHLPMFLRAFPGVPGCEAVRKNWSAILDEHKTAAIAHLRKHHEAERQGQRAESFAEGVLAVQEGFLHQECAGQEFLKKLEAWKMEAGDGEIPADSMKRFDQIILPFRKALEEGNKAFQGINRGLKKI